MCHLGGPTSTFAGTAGPTVVQWFGYGLLLGQVIPARSGLALQISDPDQSAIVGAAGSGDGPGPVFATRLSAQLPLAENALGTTLLLETAPLA